MNFKIDASDLIFSNIFISLPLSRALDLLTNSRLAIFIATFSYAIYLLLTMATCNVDIIYLLQYIHILLKTIFFLLQAPQHQFCAYVESGHDGKSEFGVVDTVYLPDL